MNKVWLTGLCVAAGLSPLRAAETNEKSDLDVHVFTLSNGMQVWLNEDHTTPTVFGGVAVRAGAKDCPDTGIAHYFEHIMFKGTDKIGTVDYEEEKPILDSIETQYARLNATDDPALRREILARINELTVESARYAVPNEFSQLTALFGGSGLNAGTSYDYTVYFNTFSSQHIEPWLELNSERMIDPVFRLFQSELETVYEEKNMYSDNMAMGALEHATERIFSPHPYAKPILGSSESLKHPDMAAMRDFYDRYYVAGNMALLLSGDFDTDEALPLIERYFSRIPAGEPLRPAAEMPRPFVGRETASVKVPVPLVRAAAGVWRTVPLFDPDEAALSIAAALLTNDNGTGYLDRLMKERKVMMAGAANINFNEAGILALLYIPKMLFTGLSGAEKRVLEAVGQIRSGTFTDEEFNSAKLEYMKNSQLQLEDQYSRANTMIRLYTGGRSWADYLADRQRVGSLTREDIVRVANQYLGGDRLVLEKKTGSYPKDKLEKPGFETIRPQTAVTRSEYGEKLVARYRRAAAPRFIDFGKELSTGELPNGDTLFAARNPYNGIFRLEFNYAVGYNRIPAAQYLPAYLEYAGAGGTSNVGFQQKLRAVGATIGYRAEGETFTIVLEGFDDRFAESYALLKEFVATAAPEKKGVKSIVDLMKMERKAIKKDAAGVSDAGLQYALYGDNAERLREMTLPEVKNYPEDGFIRDLHTICDHRADVYYSGNNPLQEVIGTVGGGLGTGRPAQGERAFYPLSAHTEPLVYLLNVPQSRQSIINTCVYTGDMTDSRDRAMASLFNMYVGGSMNSLLFREIREYRSYAYAVSSGLKMPKRYEKETDGYFRIYMTTQADKTVEAIGTLDSLMSGLTFVPERLEQAKLQLANDMNNSFPNFREIARIVDDFRKEGYAEDPRKALFEELGRITAADMQAFYEERIAGKPVVYVITADTKQLGPAAVDRFGRVVTVKAGDVTSR